jgi:VIT1/CCC1 family predicted Fe2+/Mn2+ transporter
MSRQHASSDPHLDEAEGHPYEDEHAEDPQSGVLRASVFGASDGLVSNLALVMGVAGGSGDPQVIVVAGIAGLLAGAFSMGAGEYISMQTQRELLERELALEREHILKYPAEEEAHLAELLAGTGLDADDARRIAGQIHQSVDPAVDFHAMFELGFHPKFLGEPRSAALWSFASFALGAFVPVLPWLVTPDALTPSLALSAVALLGVGALATRLTRRTAWFGALRQLGIGALSAAVTYGAGVLLAGYVL